MHRRRFLTISALSITLTRCIAGWGGDATETPSPTATATATDTPIESVTGTETLPAEGTTPECWPSMCEGTQLVKVDVAHGFLGGPLLQADCRDEGFAILSGESVQIDRETDGETCEITLTIDGEQAFSANIEDSESLTLTVDTNGDIETHRVVL